MKAIVTGGAGFLGSHLCERLLGQGDEVVCVDNLLTGSAENVAHLLDRPGMTFLRRDVAALGNIPGRVDAIFHLASPASPRDYLKYPIETLRAGSLGTQNCLEMAKMKQARFLLASTSEVYGNPQIHPQTEDYWGYVNPVGPRSVYDEAKRFSEAITMAYHRAHGIEVRIARIFNTYGPRLSPSDGRVVSNMLAQALRTGRSLCMVTERRHVASATWLTRYAGSSPSISRTSPGRSTSATPLRSPCWNWLSRSSPSPAPAHRSSSSPCRSTTRLDGGPTSHWPLPCSDGSRRSNSPRACGARPDGLPRSWAGRSQCLLQAVPSRLTGLASCVRSPPLHIPDPRLLVRARLLPGAGEAVPRGRSLPVPNVIRAPAMTEIKNRINTSTPAVVLKFDPNVMHHGGLGVIRSLGRIGVPVYGVHEGPWAPAAIPGTWPGASSGSPAPPMWTAC